MNEMDLLSRMRDEVPLGVSPRAEHLFRTALFENGNPERAVVPPPRPRWRGRPGVHDLRVARRAAFVVSLAAAVAAAVLVMVLPSRGQAPSGQPTRGHAPSGQPLPAVKLLADRAAAAALSGPDVNPGQWVYREMGYAGESGGQYVKGGTQELWATADDLTQVNYYNGSPRRYYRGRDYNGVQGMLGFFAEPLSYRSLGSLPAQPGALVTRLAEIGAHAHTGEPAGCSQSAASCTTFLVIAEFLSGYVMPPALTAELYRALGDIPGVSAVPNVANMAGPRGVAFRITLKGGYLELIINPSTYQLMATQGSYPGGTRASVAILRQALVSGPGVRP